jgi:hypothetical protein
MKKGERKDGGGRKVKEGKWRNDPPGRKAKEGR